MVPEECAKLPVALHLVSAYQNVRNKVTHGEWFVQTEMKPGIRTVKSTVNVACATLTMNDANQLN